MNRRRWVRLLLLSCLVFLTACNREPQLSVSPVGMWEGTLFTMTGGLGTQPFTAEIAAVAQAELLYEGAFTVGSTSYDVSGSYEGNRQEGAYFEFRALPPEMRAATSNPFPYGFDWSGVVTETRYTGSWYVYEYPDGTLSVEGTFSLERTP